MLPPVLYSECLLCDFLFYLCVVFVLIRSPTSFATCDCSYVVHLCLVGPPLYLSLGVFLCLCQPPLCVLPYFPGL